MSWLFFADESGHDHKQMPYEVRGGAAIHVSKVWNLVRDMQRLELECFGSSLALYKKELKGSTLLDRKRFRFAAQSDRMPDEERRKQCRRFLTRGLEKQTPKRDEFSAYGQACLLMAEGILDLLFSHDAVVLASAIPKGVARPEQSDNQDFLRKDQVFLFERLYYLLEEKQEHGVLVMDEVEKVEDRRFVKRLQSYFTKTVNGRNRARWIVPSPFFVSSDMSYLVQAADVCLYCINWGFRVPGIGLDAEVRSEIADRFGPLLSRLQYRGEGYRAGEVFRTYGIFHVQDPYEAR